MNLFFRRQPRKPLNRATARNSALLNQLATPGLGSLMAGRITAGIGQLLLAVAGFGMVVAWFVTVIIQFYGLIGGGDANPRSVSWLGLAGFGVFGLAWLWALVTTVGILREGRRNEVAEFDQVKPPRMDSA